MKASIWFLTAIAISTIAALPAGAEELGRTMKFEKELPPFKNNGLYPRSVSMQLVDGQPAGLVSVQNGCWVRVVVHAGEEAVIEAGRVVRVSMQEINENSMFLWDPATGAKIGSIQCPRGGNEQDVMNLLRTHVGLVPETLALKRVPIKYEEQSPEHTQEAGPQLIQPVFKEQEPADSVSSEL